MKKQCSERHFIHFQCNNVTVFIEIEPNGDKWVHFPAGCRMAYSCIKGGLKNLVFSVMSQHNLVSAWRG